MGRSAKAVLLAFAFAAACRTASAPSSSPPIVQPGAPGEPTRPVTAAAATARPAYTDADVKFMQGMIHHHAQALDMVDLLKTRTTSDDMRKLAERIEISQADEIGMMQKWLAAHGQDAPQPARAATAAGDHAHHMTAGQMPMMMPGMLNEQQMNQLAGAKGPEFDQLFLEFMIQHHQGALTMVKELFETPGAAQDADVFAFASDVDADQRAEITRMSAMLKEHQT